MRTLVIALTVALLPISALAQVQPESFSFPVGLDPQGDNFLALRSRPSNRQGVRLAKLGPGTLFREIGRSGDWAQVRLPTGETGWVSARYVGCCRSAAAASPTVSAPPPAAAPITVPIAVCEDLWYRRNLIFKSAGLCFRSSRGISTFGNAGCQFDKENDMPMSERERQAAAVILQQERSLGCSE